MKNLKLYFLLETSFWISIYSMDYLNRLPVDILYVMVEPMVQNAVSTSDIIWLRSSEKI
jgi:hypothetical protein